MGNSEMSSSDLEKIGLLKLIQLLLGRLAK